MPVTPQEWESGVAYTSLAKGLLSFLRENSPMGYSADELFNVLDDIGSVYEFEARNIQPHVVEKALEVLVADEQLESKELKDETASKRYYRATD